MSARIRSSIRSSLLSAVAPFNPLTATAEQAELAAAQLLAADELFADQAGSAFAESLADPNSRWKLFAKDFLSSVTHALPNGYGSINVYPTVRNGILYMAGRHTQVSTGGSPNAITAMFAVGDLNGEKVLTSYGHTAAAAAANQPAHRVQIDPVRGPYVFGNDGSVGSYYYGISGQAAGPGFLIASYAWHTEFARSIVAGTNKQVSTSTDSQTGYVGATLPGLGAVNWNAACCVMCTPTAVLIPTGDLHTAANGFLRSTDGVTYALIPGITGLGGATNTFTSEFVAGRLYMCTNRGLWSTADNGTTWRNDIATTASIEQLFGMSDGRLMAVGGGGIWHGAADGTGFTRVSTINPGAPRVLVPDQRLLYSANGVYTETGVLLIAPIALDWNIGRCMAGQNVMTPVDFVGGTAHEWLAPTTAQLIPDGPNSIILLKNAINGACAAIRQAFPVYVPPRTGQRLRIVAIGAGGDIGNGGIRSFAGQPTTAGNVLVAAGGPASSVGIAVSAVLGRPGGTGLPVSPIAIPSGADAIYRVRGGAGVVIKGQRFGDGVTMDFLSPVGGPATLNGETMTTGAPGTLRGGTGAIPVSWTGTITDPLPMVIPGRRHSRALNAATAPTSGSEYSLGSLRGAEWGEAPGGAVAILEL